MPSSQTQRTGIQKIVFVFFMSASLWLALFAVASAEVITSFHADYEVQEDSSVIVTETINYDFQGAQRHGIFRNIRDKHPQPASVWYKEGYVDIQLLSVKRDSQPEPYKLEAYDGLSVRIGDADKTITGQHQYVIVYVLAGALSEYSEGVEFYWNVTGNEWEVPIQQVTAVVRARTGVSLETAQYCYAGTPGSTSVCDNKEIILNESVGGQAVFKNGTLKPGQEFTIAQEINLSNPSVVLESTNYLLFILLGALSWFVILGFRVYRWRTAYKPNQTIIPQYEPYQDFKPMFTGVLIDNRLDSSDISAGIVYLAQQGFLSIKQTTDKVLFLFDTTDYEVTQLRPIEEVETNFLKEVLGLLFIPSHVYGAPVKLSKISKDSTKRIVNAKIIKELRKAVVKDLVEGGFLEQRIKRVGMFILIFICVWGSFFFVGVIFALVGSIGVVVEFIFFGSCIIYLLFALERRTRKGFEALNYLKGFKEFLSVTEKERYKFHNAPSLSPQQFMEYLPYAIAFGIEKEWAEVFKDIQIDNPDWYNSSTGETFNAATFTTGLGAFSTAFSGSTGSSGSSGGGSSGGGGGGGGGGSW